MMLALFRLQNSQHQPVLLTRIQVRVSRKSVERDQDGEAIATDTSNPTPDPGNQNEVPSAEGWVALCARAAVEQDPKKLLDLIIEINRLLDARRKRLLNGVDGTSERNTDETSA
jgi:hypothetical protein